MLQCCSAAYHVTRPGPRTLKSIQAIQQGVNKENSIWVTAITDATNCCNLKCLTSLIPFLLWHVLFGQDLLSEVGAVLGQGIRLTFATIRVGKNNDHSYTLCLCVDCFNNFIKSIVSCILVTIISWWYAQMNKDPDDVTSLWWLKWAAPMSWAHRKWLDKTHDIKKLISWRWNQSKSLWKYGH